MEAFLLPLARVLVLAIAQLTGPNSLRQVSVYSTSQECISRLFQVCYHRVSRAKLLWDSDYLSSLESKLFFYMFGNRMPITVPHRKPDQSGIRMVDFGRSWAFECWTIRNPDPKVRELV